MSSSALSMDEFRGLSAMARARQDNLRTLFEGTSLTFGKYSKEKIVKNVVSDAGSLASKTKKMIDGIRSGSSSAAAVSQAGDIHSNGMELLKIASGLNSSDLVDALGSDVLHSLISELTPFIGVLTSSYKSVKSWKAVVENARDLYKSDYYLKGVLPGDPTAAAEAVIVVIKRFLAANTADAVRNTASASAKIAGLFADMGTATTAAIGAASALSKLIQELVILGRDYVEMKAGNEYLKNPAKLDLNVFQVCPVLGCYLIACSDSSMVLNFFIADVGLPGWMDKVEAMKKNQLDPLIKNANKGIVAAHLTLAGLQSNKGVLQKKGTLELFKENVKNQFNQLIKSNAKRLVS